MPTIEISKLSGAVFKIATPDSTWQVELPSLCSADDQGALQWYFEDYAEQDPFQTSKALHAANLIDSYGRNLFTVLELGERFVGIEGQHVQIDVATSADNEYDNTQYIFWEALEDQSLWPFPSRPLSVCVSRTIQLLSPPLETQVSLVLGKKPEDAVNVLVVTARPQLDRDIPHRFVSSIILRIAQTAGEGVRVELVRPGTFDAFEKHIKGRPPGFFDVVHFDLHGFATKKEATLSFLKQSTGSKTLTSDPRSAADVGRVLHSCDVPCVVLNACRSAKGGSPNANIAIALVENGISRVAAMSHKVGTSAVERFTNEFYQSMLLDGQNFETSAALARAALRSDPKKQTKFGTVVDVFDYLVPVCFKANNSKNIYVNSGSRVSTKRLFPSVANTFIGRENDILLLECKLLLESNIGVLWGPPGVGKTTLLDHLAEWWYDTHLITNNICFDLDSQDPNSEPIDMSQVREYLAEHIRGQEKMSEFDVVDHLNKHPYLVVVDHLDSWKIPSDSSVSKQRGFLKSFLSMVHGGRSLFIFASRRSEAWLEKIVPAKKNVSPAKTAFSRPLTGLLPIRGINLFTNLLTDRHRQAYMDDREMAKYMESLVKLVDGNPLALELLCHDFLSKEISVQQYILDLLAGAPIALSEHWIQNQDGARSVRQLQEYINWCIDPGEELRQSLHMDTVIRIMRQERIRPTDLIHAIPPTFFGALWTAIPMDDLRVFIIFVSLQNAQMYADNTLLRSPSSTQLEASRYSFCLDPDALSKIPKDSKESYDLEGLMDLVDTAVSKMLDWQFLSLSTFNTTNLPRKGFYHINPILTIVARSSQEYRTSHRDYEDALILFQTHCANKFPLKYQYWNPIWTEPKKEIGLVFYNYYAATLLVTKRNGGNYLTELSILRLIPLLSKGIFSDLGRYEMLNIVLQQCFSRGMSILDDVPTIDPVSAGAFLHLAGITDQNPLEIDEETLMIMNLSLKLCVVLQVTLCAQALEISIFDSLLATKEPYSDKVQPILRKAIDETKQHIQHGLAFFERFVFIMEYKLKSFESRDSASLDEFWERRQKFFQEEISWCGVEEMPTNQTSVMDVPRSLNSLSVPFAALIDLDQAVKTLVSQQKYREARESLKSALDSEFNFGANQIKNKVRILLKIAAIDAEEEHWDDAIANTNRAYELEDSRGKTMSQLRIVEREGRLVDLYEKAGDFDTMKALRTSLLRRANQAHPSQPEIEIKALLSVYRLQSASRIDEDIAAVFILLRAAKTSYRNGLLTRSSANNDNVPYLFRMMHHVTTPFQENWVMGAPDPRPQTVAISFVLMLFGQLVVPELCSRMMSQQSMIDNPSGLMSDSEMDYAVAVSLELEERLFVEDETRFTYDYIPEELDYTLQRQLFTHFYECGEQYLKGALERDVNGDLIFPKAPWTPATVWGTVGSEGVFAGTIALPSDYTCPTKIMLRLAGYIIDEDP